MSDERVVKFVQELIQDEPVGTAMTPDLFEQIIERVLTIQPRWRDSVNRQAVLDELIRRNSQWIGQDSTLQDSSDHESWLVPERKRNWRYWQRYREWLERSLSLKAVDALDQSTDRILGLLEDPARPGRWCRKGLVVGHVQSGKTSNYTALIGKAADAGYKIIIVLAGLHNNLRAQTQMRLDEGFLGYETRPLQEDNFRPIGVGEIDTDPSIRPNFATNRTESGDFNASTAKTLGISPEQRPWLFVVKKNKTVLERLCRWIRNHVADTQDGDRRLVTAFPLLLIDDESDHASVDTGEQSFDQNGKPDLDHEPTAINSRIRRILNSFARSAYVGYTATPFANIFIHERSETSDEGPDLFPSSFIVNLGAPSNYVGPSRVFGRTGSDGREGELPLTRQVSDHASEDGKQGWMPTGHKNTHHPVCANEYGLPQSLVEAIDAFILACATRQLRGQGADHCSMLIHVTRFNAVQRVVHEQVKEHIRGIRQRLHRRIGQTEHLTRLRQLWEADFLPTHETVVARVDPDSRMHMPAWEAVERVLPDVLEGIDTRTINGTAKDALDYAEQSSTGLKVIAIGGDKLARGLTLEGLCVSYFLRASKMYDTLMQMGRWFGYRPGYLDLCRLYTTPELEYWFGLISDASDELREEFEIMARIGATPREYGLRVKAHPGLMITSRVKMRSAKTLRLSFSGHVQETINFFLDPAVLNANLAAVRNLVTQLGTPETQLERPWKTKKQPLEGRFLWRNATADDVLEFLDNYRTHPDAYKANSTMLAQFIRTMVSAGELTEWSVALIGIGDTEMAKRSPPKPAGEYVTAPYFDLSPAIRVAKLIRAQAGKGSDSYVIKRLLSPQDEAVDVDEATWNAALEVTQVVPEGSTDPATSNTPPAPSAPSGVALRKVRGQGAAGVPATPQRGLLLLYLLDPERSGASLNSHLLPPVAAFGISFPDSSLENCVVEYKVNNVGWELDYAD